MESVLNQSLTKSSRNSPEGTLDNPPNVPTRNRTPNDMSSTDYLVILKSLLINAAPVFISMTCVFSDRIYTTLLLNKRTKDPNILAAAGLGGAWLALVSMSIFFSLNAGLTSRASQAYGAKKYRQVGLYMHRAFIINGIILVPCIILLFYSENFFSLLRFDPKVAEITKEYLLISIPGTFAMVIYLTLSSVLNGCGLFKIPSGVQIIVSIFYLFFAYIFIDLWDMRLVGGAICYCLTWILATIILIAYIYKKDPLPGVFFWPVEESYKEIWDLFKYEAIIGSMTWVDFIAMEIMIIFTGQLPVHQTAAYTVASNVYRLPAPLGMAVGVTTMSFTGNAIGEKNKVRAQRVLTLACGLMLLIVIVVEFLFSIYKESWIDAFASDETTAMYALATLQVYLCQFPAEGVQLILANGVKAIGKEKVGSMIIALADYVVAIPVAYFMCFVMDLGVKGVAMGSASSIYSKLIMFGYLYTKIDWDEQIQVVSFALRQKRALGQPREDDVELTLRKNDQNTLEAEELEEDIDKERMNYA